MKAKLYEALINGLPEDATVQEVFGGPAWTAARLSGGGVGMAAHFAGACDFAAFSGIKLRNAAKFVLSTDQETAGAGMAVINAYYNSPARLNALGAQASGEKICTDGLDLSGKTVGMIGHMRRTAAALSAAERLWIFELDPQEGDLPASEEDKRIPECDIVVITGTALINHTLPGLLSLAENADVILLGPTVPLCPELLNFGIRRLAGLVLARPDDFFHRNRDTGGSPMSFGESFLLGK